MGKAEPNLKIGTNDFYDMATVSSRDADICNDNCVLIEQKCETLESIIAYLSKLFGTTSDLLKCPLR